MAKQKLSRKELKRLFMAFPEIKNKIKMSKRNWSITKIEGEWYNAKCTDSYGVSHQNWFEHAYDANDWIYYMWETEKPPLDQEERDELLANAIHDCRQIDQRAGLRAIL